MRFILKNNQWEISYLDSNRVPHTFYHPTEVLDTELYNETGVRHMIQMTEQKINQIFPTDSYTEGYINFMKETAALTLSDGSTFDGIQFGDAPSIE